MGKKSLCISLIAFLMAGGLYFTPVLSAAEASDTIYINGLIYTVDANFSVVSAIAVKGDKIIYVGDSAKARAEYANAATKLVDLKGGTVLPGLIESHMHYQLLGASLDRIDIFNKSKAEILQKVKAEAEKLGDGEWIVSMGWNNVLWNEDYPTKEDLDAVSPKNPVALSRADGHSTWCNSLALSIAGITEKTPNPRGGEILKKANGEMWGILTDTAADSVSEKIPESVSPQRILKRYQLADRQVVSLGITTLVDAGVSRADIKLLKDAYAKGLLKVRAYEMLEDGEDELYIKDGNKPVADLYKGKLSVKAVKLYSDGSLGSRSAWMLEEYTDRRGHHGNGRWADDEMYAKIKRIAGEGFQIGVHAIGDAAARQVINTSKKVIDELKLTDHRFRIEHFQVVNADDIPKAIEYGIIPSMQAVHAISDMNMAEDRVGPARIESAYAWRAIIDKGGIIPNGSDAPVEMVTPFFGLYASVTRRDADGRPPDGWHAEQSMTKEEALKSFTIWGAYASFSEKTKGSLEAGKYADFVVLDKDYMKCSPREIYDLKVLKTVIGGEVVYEYDEAP